MAERAIRSIVDLMRVELLSSGLTSGNWIYAANHAVDVLNRTTGPPGDASSSYEALTGERPRVLPILPLGCRAYVVKPQSFVRKTLIPTRAWRGINYGRSVTIPGAYNVFVKSTGRVHVTSDVYFTERYFPLRPKGTRHAGPELPVRAVDHGEAQPPGVPAAVPVTLAPSPPTNVAANVAVEVAPPTLADAFDTATRTRPHTARASRTVLILFSGPYERPDGLAVFLRRLGFLVELVDNDPPQGGRGHC